MTSSSSLSHFFQSRVKVWTVASLVVALLLSFFILHEIAKREGAKRALEVAETTSQAFRSVIFSGDILGSELQAKKAFHLEADEDIVILDPAKKPMLAGRLVRLEQVCLDLNAPCRKNFSNKISAIVPIYFDNNNSKLFGYVFVVINEKVNWSFLISLSLGILASLLVLSLGLIASMSSAFGLVSKRLLSWSIELKENPKNLDLEGGAPFSELDPVHLALTNLKEEIYKLERDARTEGKLTVLRGIAHDVMTPVSQLKKMLGVVQLQMNSFGKPSEEAIEKFGLYLKKIERIASQVLVLNENQFERNINVPKIKIFETLVNIVSEIQEEDIFTENNLSIRLEGASTSIARITKLDLERIIINLVRNAAFASDRKQEILVRLKDYSYFIEIVIQDFGSGIPIEVQDQIFEVDFSTRPSTGTGLGLPIVKSICDRNRIQVSFHSVPGAGSEFKIKIPVDNGSLDEVQNFAR